MQKQKAIKITLPFFSNLFLRIVAIINRFLIFFQLREKRQYWGIVYDSVTKQPLDPVKVSLVYADSGKAEGSCITDLAGRYGFLARPGRFKIFVQRTNYVFPSKIVNAMRDGIYSHLYHGEFLDLTEDSEVVAPNIPMDPVSQDWNQQAKKNFVHKAFYLEWLLEKFITVMLWFGFVYTSVLLILSSFTSRPLLTALAVYLALFVLELITPHPRLWGQVLDSSSGQPVEGLNLELFSAKTPDVIFGRALSRDDGRFFLRANPGSYLLQVADPQGKMDISPLPVKVRREGVLNQKILLDF